MKILICGDYIVYDDLKVNSKEIFGEFIDTIKEADIAVYNQEFPVTQSSKIYPTKKYGLTSRSSADSLIPIVNAGFNYASLANNHIFNRGILGLKDTINNLNKLGITSFGAGEDIEAARKVLYIEKKGIKLAFLNFAENEFNSATSTHGGSNPLNIIDNIKQIQEAKLKADFVFVIIHGGIDYCPYPSPRIVKQYRFYAENGASAIIGHHNHVVSGYEVYKETPIFYSIGNFIPGKIVIDDCLFSYPVQFEIDDDKKVKFKGYPLKFNRDKFKLEFLRGDDLQQFIDKQNKICSILNDESLLKKKIITDFLTTEKKSYYFTLFTRSNYFLFKLFRKLNFISLYYSYILKKMRINKRNSAMWNLNRCETHKDVLDIIYEEYIDTYSNK